jgi:VWFA-related protein
MKKLLYLFLVFLCYEGLAQSLSVFDVDATSFPTVKAKFFAFDASGNPITNLSPSDFEVKENGQTRNVTFVSCPPAKPPQALSSVLVIDVSGSMGWAPQYNINLAKEAARAWVEGLPLGKSECAITSFDHMNYMVQDFTTDRAKLLAGITGLQAQGGTNYDAAMLNPPAGGLLITKNGKYKRVIVFLTDGMPNFEPQTARIIQEARQQNATIYGVTLNMPCPQNIKDMTTQTGGQWFENVTTVEEARRIYLQILQTAQGGDPCEIHWQSDIPCTSGNTQVEITLLQNGTKATTSYQVPSNAIARLEFTPPSVRFNNPAVGVKRDTTVKVTARNASFTVTNITISDPNFSIAPRSFTLSDGESIDLTVSYTPPDSSNRFCVFEFENNRCPTKYYASGGWRGKKPVNPTLRVVHPNGGEEFVVGSDTVIRWEGVSAKDTVNISYSTDNGARWKLLTKEGTNLEYKWRNIPLPPSRQCLVRVSQGDIGNSSTGDPEPHILWQKAFGGSKDDQATSIIESSDGTLIVGGYTSSNDGDVKNNKGGVDCWVVKIRHSDGSIIWRKNFGGTKDDYLFSIFESSEGGYIVAGNTTSNNGDVSGNKGASDVWIVKLSRTDGSIVWQKTYGGKGDDWANYIIETTDRSYLVVGATASSDGDVNGNKGIYDYWIVKIRQTDGSIIWQRNLGGNGWDEANCVIESSDGTYVVAGLSGSKDGDVIGNKGDWDFWIVKIRSTDGSIIWQKTMGGSLSDNPNSIIESSDGSYVVAGETYSNDGDVSGNHSGGDLWVVKIRPDDGSIIWQKALGGSRRDYAYSIIESSDGSYVVAGFTGSNDGDVRGNHGGQDSWVVKLRPSDGSIIWQKALGGSGWEETWPLTESSDGSYVVAGSTTSNDGDVSGNHGGSDFWVVKLQETEILQSDVSDSVFAIVEPHCTARDIDMKECLVGSVKDSVVAPFIQNIDNWAVRVDSIYFRGADATAFDIVSGIPPYEVPPNGSHHCEFRFKPTRVGLHQAQVVVITQTDTLVQSIRGIGVQPQLAIVSDIIDFGKVDVGKAKDTLQVVTIKNIGTVPLTITSTRHNKPNDKDFTTLAGGGAFTLQPGETRLMDLRFKPSDVGRTSGTLEFEYNGVGSPAVVQLFGEGVKRNPRIQSLLTPFDTLVCEVEATRTLEIKNEGGEDLLISDVSLTGANKSEFEVNVPLPLRIEPDSLFKLTVVFKPQGAGTKQAELVIISNSDPDSVLTIDLVARKDSVALMPEVNEIKLGYLCPNEGKDTVLTVRNEGTIASGGYAQLSANLSSTNANFVIASPGTYALNISFKGSPSEGTIDESVVVYDSVCGYARTVRITGEVAAPSISGDDVTLVAIKGSTKVGTIVLRNNSKRDVEIRKPPLVLAPFAIDGSVFPIRIPAGGSYNLPVSYTPDDSVEDSITLTFEGEPCNVSGQIQVTGKPVVASALLEVIELAAYPGDEIEVPIILSEGRNLALSGATSFKTDLSYNPTLLWSMDYPQTLVNESTAKITLENLPVNIAAGEPLAKVRFKVGLGNAEGCDLELTNASVDSGTVDITLINGRFKLLGICREGGARLVNPKTRAGIISIMPNPAEERMEIEITLTEVGTMELVLYDMMGNKVKTLYHSITTAEDFASSTNDIHTSVDIRDVGTGQYILILKTPTYTEARQVMIVR